MAPLNGKVALFGGASITDDLSDTWTWDGTTWTQLSVTGPSARTSPVMAPLKGKLVLFGGLSSNALSDTWSWDGTTWAQLSVTGPSARYFGAER